MRHTHRLLAILLLVALAGFAPALAQRGFGKNKISASGQVWKVYRSPHFDVNYNFEDEAMLREVVSEAESAYLDIGRRLDHEVSQRIPMILYGTHAQFRRTNIQFRELPEGVAAFAEPFQFRLVLPVDSPPEERYKLIRHEMTHIYQFDILYAQSVRRTLQGRAPFWFMEGMASYVADDESTMDHMFIRDAVVNNRVPSVRQLGPSFMTYRFGHAIFDFIEDTWGDEGLQNLIFEMRKSLLAQNLDKAFRDAFGTDLDTFERRFNRYLRQKYLPILTTKRSPDEYGKEVGVHRKNRMSLSPALSPSGELIAAIALPKNEFDVVIISPKDGKVIRNITRGYTNSYQNVVTEAFSGNRDLTWSPDGDRLAFFVNKEWYRVLLVFDPVTGKLQQEVPFKEIAATASPAFSPDGAWVAFSGNVGGQWDIFRYNLNTGVTENLTEDPYVDTNPTFSSDGKQVIYNRTIGAFAKIFVVQVGNPQRKTQLTAGASSDLNPVFSKDGKYVYFTSDRGLYGVFNIHRMEIATAKIDRLTDLTAGGFSPVEADANDEGVPQIVFSAFYDGTYRLFKMPVAGDEVDHAIEAGQKEPQTSPLAASRRAALDTAREEARRDAAAVDYEGVALAVEEREEDLEPFRPPLQLSLDEDKKEDYKRRFRMDAPGVTVGVADDGNILAVAQLTFTDLLGDTRIALSSASYNGYSDNRVSYLDQSGRIDWGAWIRDYRDYYLASDFNSVAFDDVLERRNRFTNLGAFASYPFSRHYRVEGQVGYAQRRSDYPQALTDALIPTDFIRLEDDYPFVGIDFVGDTVRYGGWGPVQGHHLRVGTTYYTFTDGDSDGESITNFHLDFRGYRQVTKNSVLAMRVSGVFQDGQRGNIFAIGGIDQLRGYRYREFFGENYVYVNLEYRFPLINFLQWGFGGRPISIRGFLFADAGTAWFEDETYLVDPANPSAGTAVGRAFYDRRLNALRAFETWDGDFLQDIKVSVGAGLTVPLLGIPATWAFSSIWDGEDFGPWHSSFYIVYNW